MTGTVEARVEGERAVVLRVGPQALRLEPDRIYVVGSGEKADLRLVHASVARAHTMLSLHEGRLTVEDLGSEAGTWAGGERLTGVRELAPGEPLRIGAIAIAIEQALPVRDPAAAAVPPRGEPTFGELMADELRRAPWFGLSILLHALLLAVLWLLVPDENRIGRDPVAVQLQPPAPAPELADTRVPEERFEVEELERDSPEPQQIVERSLLEQLDETPVFEDPSMFAPNLLGPNDSMFERLGGASDILKGGGSGDAAWGAFGRTVEDLRGRGLEIVFVVDSTGSMGPVLEATRRRMLSMLEALHALVQNKARVGVVAYRDHGQREEYVTRVLPLTRDFYRAMNFMHTVEAAGGGDRPEAVLEAIEAAAQQSWSKSARRVIVLIGDAPAQPRSRRALQRTVRGFVREGQSHVHAIMTSVDMRGTIDADTNESFREIADIGKGVCVAFEDERRLLEQVLSLAIGPEFRASIAEVYRRLESRNETLPRRVTGALRDRDRERIERLLARGEQRVVREIAASQDPGIARLLVDILAAPDVRPSVRQAASWALREQLGLRRPPIPADRDVVLAGEQVRALQEAIEARLGR